MKINEREYELAFTGETLLIYKENFHRDFISIVADPTVMLDDYELLFSVVWSLIKNREGLPNYRDFMRSLSAKDMMSVINIETVREIVTICNDDMSQDVELKKKTEEEEENL